METKKCIKCGTIKPLYGFYKHPQLKDGHSNKCIECSKEYAKQHITKGHSVNSMDLRLKRYKVHSGLIPDKIYSYLYPEKVAAQSAANSLPTQEGKHKHHWSYNLDHWKNVIYLTPSEHRLAHYYIRYDQERMMYRRLDGTLLATKSEHLAYINGLFK
jgi:hypothetical protein